VSARSLDVPPYPARDALRRSPRRRVAACIGREGERVARDYLWAAGHRIVAMNARVGHDELDLISVDTTGALVFSEVRSYLARTDGHPQGLATLRRPKLERWARAARAWLRGNVEFQQHRCRFDALAIELSTPSRVAHARGLALPCADERACSLRYEP